uniref:Glutathione peroxidase n=1 Tax=Arion vulgaris TaxID=1028688 RepID=A0A0B6ZP98_9EUPU
MEVTGSILNRKWLLCLILWMVHAWHYGSCDLAEFTDGLDFYSYNVIDISGNDMSLEKYRGKVSLVVNVASQCGYTQGHYQGLILLQEYFGSTEKFNVLAFPCDQFGHQEPGTDSEIMNFANHKMGANFPLFAKVNVKKEDVSPVWNYLTRNSGQTPTWNFWKYLVDHNGHVLSAWGPSTNPDQLYPAVRVAISNAEKEESSRRDESRKEL